MIWVLHPWVPWSRAEGWALGSVVSPEQLPSVAPSSLHSSSAPQWAAQRLWGTSSTPPALPTAAEMPLTRLSANGLGRVWPLRHVPEAPAAWLRGCALCSSSSGKGKTLIWLWWEAVNEFLILLCLHMPLHLLSCLDLKSLFFSYFCHSDSFPLCSERVACWGFSCQRG